MPFCSFAQSAAMFDMTPIENLFLLEYLPTAPDGFLRVYLYARMLSLHPELGGGLDEMAAALNMTTDAVFNAMTYWERQGLVCRLTDQPPTYQLLAMRSERASDPMDADYYAYRDFNGRLQGLFGAGNLIGPKQYGMAYDWLTILKFSQDAVVRMVEAQIQKSRSKNPDPARIFKKVNEQAAAWAERGITSLEDVERALEIDGNTEKIASAVLKRLAIRRAPTMDELKLVSTWVGEWKLTEDEILNACAETTKSRTPSMSYLNSILETRRIGEGELFEGAKEVLRELMGPSCPAPTPDQVRSYGTMLARGFEPEAIRFAAVQCSRKNKRRFEELEWMLDKWAGMKLFTGAAAEAYVRDMNRTLEAVRGILELCGTERRPQMDDLARYSEWQKEYSDALIRYAAECARGMQLPIKYMDKLLSEWKKAGISDPESARAAHESRSARSVEPAKNPALNYAQRTYTDKDFEGFFVDLSDGEGK